MEEKVFKMEGFQSWWLSWSDPGPTWEPNPDHSKVTTKTKNLSFFRLFLPGLGGGFGRSWLPEKTTHYSSRSFFGLGLNKEKNALKRPILLNEPPHYHGWPVVYGFVLLSSRDR